MKQVAVTVLVLVGLLLLDGQLGPVTFTLRRVLGATLLATVVLYVGLPRRQPLAVFLTWISVVAVALAPAVSVASLAFVFGLNMLARPCASASPVLAAGVAPACLGYVLVKFFIGLFPQSRAVEEGASAFIRSYLSFADAGDHYLSPAATGAPAIGMLVLFLLWRWKHVGGQARLWGAVTIPLLWFLLLAVVMRLGDFGPIGIFCRAAAYGVLWILCAAVLDVFCSSARVASSGSPAARSQPGFVAVVLAGLFIGVVIVGGVHFGEAPHKSVLVHNRGGLDWERPQFGRFGAFSGGMFGLFPVYSRANGYQFEVLERDTLGMN